MTSIQPANEENIVSHELVNVGLIRTSCLGDTFRSGVVLRKMAYLDNEHASSRATIEYNLKRSHFYVSAGIIF